MKRATVTILVACAAILIGAGNARAEQTPFALRAERGTCVYNGVTTQTIERTFGTNIATLPFAGTTTYDFYSPPTLNCVTLKSQNHAWGTVAMANTGNSKDNDFTVTGRMVFYDYDSASGTEV